MIKRTRTAIFIVLIIAFLTIAPLTVLYCLGWRFDFETRKITQPGMFYFKAWPRNCQIYINGDIKKKTDIFFGSVLIENMLPDNYNVEINKEGYHSWKKNLLISKREVTEAKNVTLIPQNPAIGLISKNIESFFFSPDEKKIILREGEEEWSLKLFEPEKNIKSHLISQNDLRLGPLTPKGEEISGSVELIDLLFSDDSKRLLLTLGAKENIYHFILEIESNNLIPLEIADSEKIIFHPTDSQKVLVLFQEKLEEIDFKTKESLVILENVIEITSNYNKIYYLDKEGFIFKTSPDGEDGERLNIIPFEIKQEVRYEIKILNNNIFLEEDNSLYLFDQEKNSFEKLLEPSKNIKISLDGRKVAYFNDYEIWVKFLEKKYEQPQKEVGDKIFINRFSEQIDSLFWYTDHYLIFNTNNIIKIAEIDDRGKINIVDLAEYEDPNIFFSNRKVYVISKNNFYISENLTP